MTEPEKAFNVRGKGRHYEHPDGHHVPSVTNLISVLDKPALPRWAAKTVAEQAWKMRHSLPNLDEADAVDMLKGSPWNRSKRAADRGTTVHAYLQAVGEHDDDGAKQVAEGLRGDGHSGYVEAADELLEAFDPFILATEVTVFHPEYAGTFDALWRFDGADVLVDYKTGKGLYPEVELQLAALAYARYLDGGDTPDVMAVLLKADGTFTTRRWEFKELQPAFDAFMGCLAAWHWQKGRAA